MDNAFFTNPNITAEWLRNALAFLPDQPLLLIALADPKLTPSVPTFFAHSAWRDYREIAVICAHASEMLLAQDRPKLALAAVDQALFADPPGLSAQRLRLKVLGAKPR